MSEQSCGGTDPPAKPSSLLSNQYALLWDLADEMAREDGSDPVRCWTRIMDAYWLGEIPDLFNIVGWQDEPMEFPSRGMAMGTLHGTSLIDPQMLRGWRPEDYRDEVRRLVERNPSYGLAIRRADFERWRRRVLANPKRDNESALTVAIKKRLSAGEEPGVTMQWNQFCDAVRDAADGWVDRKRRKLKRGYSDKTIKRIVNQVRMDRQDK
jgi:hypothetical protein